MRRVIFNQKGGVGKTTITCNLAAVNAVRGRRTLVVDLDPQGNSTHYLLGCDSSALSSTLVDFFQQMLSLRFNRKGIETFVHPTPFPGLDILPSHPDLEVIQEKLVARHKIYKLQEGLARLADYQDIYIDTPPAMNFYTRSALIAADRCLIPFDCDDFARRALYSLLDNVQEIHEDHNPGLQIEGILVNEYQARANLPQKIVRALEEEGLPVLRTRISPSVKIRESHEQSCPVIHFAPGHKLADEFKMLHRELDAPPSDSVANASRTTDTAGSAPQDATA